MNDELTPGQVIQAMPDYFQPEKAGSTNATIQFDLSGEQGGQYNLKIAEGELAPAKGVADNPDLTLIAAAEDCVRIFTGQMDPTAAFMSGKLKIKGNMGLALKLQTIFKRPS